MICRGKTDYSKEKSRMILKTFQRPLSLSPILSDRDIQRPYSSAKKMRETRKELQIQTIFRKGSVKSATTFIRPSSGDLGSTKKKANTVSEWKLSIAGRRRTSAGQLGCVVDHQ